MYVIWLVLCLPENIDITKNKAFPFNQIGETHLPSLSDPTLSVLRLQIGLSLQQGLPGMGCVFSKPKFWELMIYCTN